MVSRNGHITPFMSTDESIDDKASIWTLFSHTGIYVMAIGVLMHAELGIFCCYFFWCQPARLVCQPLWTGSMWHTIVDDDVEAAPTSDVKARLDSYSKTSWESWPCMKWEPTWMESCIWIIGIQNSKSGNVISTYGLLSDLGLDQCSIHKQFERFALKDNSCFTQHN